MFFVYLLLSITLWDFGFDDCWLFQILEAIYKNSWPPLVDFALEVTTRSPEFWDFKERVELLMIALFVCTPLLQYQVVRSGSWLINFVYATIIPSGHLDVKLTSKNIAFTVSMIFEMFSCNTLFRGTILSINKSLAKTFSSINY